MDRVVGEAQASLTYHPLEVHDRWPVLVSMAPNREHGMKEKRKSNQCRIEFQFQMAKITFANVVSG